MMPDAETACELCLEAGGEVVWADAFCRVVLVGGAEGTDFPGLCRVIWNQHVAEMSDLPMTHRNHLMNIVFLVELALRRLLRPDKINLASLGNKTPHLHWHIIPRWRDDSHFPAPVWGQASRPSAPRIGPERDELHAAISAALLEFSAPTLSSS